MSVTFRQHIEQRISNALAIPGVIGLGYVGLPLSMAFVDAGSEVDDE